MKPNDIIEFSDGRVGTICWHFLDGYGGVWGRQTLDEDNLPPPQFMLRKKSVESLLRESHNNPALECVETGYGLIE